MPQFSRHCLIVVFAAAVAAVEIGTIGFAASDARGAGKRSRQSLIVESAGSHVGLVDVSTKHRRQLVLPRRFWFVGCFRFSPNGERLAFIAGPNRDNVGLFVMRTDGSQLRTLEPISDVAGFGPGCLAWSPDGRRLAVTEERGSDGTTINIVNATNGRTVATPIRSKPSDGLFCGADVAIGDWSRTNRLIFVRSVDIDPCRQSIYTADPDGRHVHLVVTGRGASPPDEPRWAPDATKVAFTVNEHVSVIDLRSGRKHVLAAGESPAWAPNGARLAFLGPLGDLWTIAPDGTHRERVAAPMRDFCGCFPSVDWQRAGR